MKRRMKEKMKRIPNSSPNSYPSFFPVKIEMLVGYHLIFDEDFHLSAEKKGTWTQFDWFQFNICVAIDIMRLNIAVDTIGGNDPVFVARDGEPAILDSRADRFVCGWHWETPLKGEGDGGKGYCEKFTTLKYTIHSMNSNKIVPGSQMTNEFLT